MLQETTAHQDDTTNITTKFSVKKISFKTFGRLTIKLKNIRKKNDKSKCQQEEHNNNNNKKSNPMLYRFASDIEEDQHPRLMATSSSTKISTTSASSSSTVTPSPNIIVSQPVASTSVTSLPDETLTVESSSKPASLFSHFNNSSVLRHKTSTTSESFTITSSEEMISPSKGQEIPKFPRLNKRIFVFSKCKKSTGNLCNNHSTITLNSSVNESSSNSDDSTYETEQVTCCSKKKKEKKKSQKKQENKPIGKTKLISLSSKDKEYIEVLDRFKTGPLQNRKVQGIIRLQMPTKLVEAHEQYKKQVAQKNNLPEPRVCHRMFHGTKTAKLCRSQNLYNKFAIMNYCTFRCGVCGIIQEGNRTMYSHYTKRMWFASSSATSLSYCSSSKTKAMFVVDVIAPSPNSILIVEKDEATIPKYLIIFQ